MKRTAAFLFALIFALCACTAPDKAPESTPAAQDEKLLSIVGFYFDTVITIKVYTQDQGILDSALERCGYYENLLSKTVEGSDVWRINNSRGQPVEVSEHTRLLLEKSIEMSDMSNGRFDITVAPVMELWDFTGGAAVLPDESAIARAAELTDYRVIELKGSMVTLPEGYMIDLGAIAKGYIADEIADYIKQKGVTRGILNFGGNVVVLGDKPDGSAWNVGIQDPDEETGAYTAVVSVTDSSVVTSGIYERGFDLDGVRYHHILDSKTGWPVQNDLAAVSIISNSSMTGDALSTACLALGRDEAEKLVSSLEGVEAVFITREGSITATQGAKDLLIVSK